MFVDCDQEEEPGLADFVRAGVVASKYRTANVIEALGCYDGMAVINRVCEAGHAAQWVADLGIGPSPLTPGDWYWDCTLDRVTVRIGEAFRVFTRGMLAELTVTLGEWYAIAEKTLTRWPIERVTVSDVPGLTFEVVPPTEMNGDWQLVGKLKVPRRPVALGAVSVAELLAPHPYRVEPSREFKTDSPFTTRDELLANVRRSSSWVVQELEDLADDRWPRPSRL